MQYLSYTTSLFLFCSRLLVFVVGVFRPRASERQRLSYLSHLRVSIQLNKFSGEKEQYYLLCRAAFGHGRTILLSGMFGLKLHTEWSNLQLYLLFYNGNKVENLFHFCTAGIFFYCNASNQSDGIHSM